MSNVMLLW